MARLNEHMAKTILVQAGMAVPRGQIANSIEAAAELVADIGSSVIKAQVPTGGRGKAGGIGFAASREDALITAGEILGMYISDMQVMEVLVESRLPVRQECYAAVMNDTVSRSPVLLFSTAGGINIEEIADADPAGVSRTIIDITQGLTSGKCREIIGDRLDDASSDAVTGSLMTLYSIYRANDAELLEINPLAILEDGSMAALDCKMIIDDSALARQTGLVGMLVPEPATELEARAAVAGLKFIELDGDIGVLANGAGLTMATMDAIRHFGGKPANFLEIGGDAYTRGSEAAMLLRDMPHLNSIVVNFCGAFARTDVMTRGIINVWKNAMPVCPVHFSVHGTGDWEAVKMIREELGIEPCKFMDDAIRAAVGA